jgi:RND family efflux transporter MFP subunit
MALVLCAGLVACSEQAPEEVETDTVVPVTVQPAQAGSVQGVIHATGTVAPAPGADLVVIAPEAARIVEISRGEGERVRRGDVLVRFEIPSSAADAGRQRAEVARAEARIATARAAQERARNLFDRGVGARREIEAADKEVADAEADLAVAQAGLAAANTVSARSLVYATFDGIVAKRSHNPGDFVEPASSDPVLRVVDPARLEVSAAIPIVDVPRVMSGARARIRGEDPQPQLVVVSRPAAVEAGTASARVRLRFLKPAPYPVGTPVEVDIEAEVHKNVTVVPVAALVREGEETAVFLAAGDKAERRAVAIGLEDGEHVEIRSGVKPGEPVIVKGQAGLPDGAAIRIEPDAR